MGPTFRGKELYITTADGHTALFDTIKNIEFDEPSSRDYKKDALDCIANSNMSFSYELSDKDILSNTTGMVDYQDLLNYVLTPETKYTVSTITADSTGIRFNCEPEFMRKEFHMPNSTLQPRNIKMIGRKTFVEWSDGTTTKVPAIAM
jgi:hypothetical protein